MGMETAETALESPNDSIYCPTVRHLFFMQHIPMSAVKNLY